MMRIFRNFDWVNAAIAFVAHGAIAFFAIAAIDGADARYYLFGAVVVASGIRR